MEIERSAAQTAQQHLVRTFPTCRKHKLARCCGTLEQHMENQARVLSSSGPHLACAGLAEDW